VTPITLRIEPPGGAVTERACEGGPLVFGRGSEADVVCADASMSRRHAQVGADDKGWFVEDLGARNRTFLNGRPIDGRARLEPGDEIRMGSTRIRFDRPAPAGPAPPRRVGDGLLGETIFRPIDDDATAIGGMDAARLAARLAALNRFHRGLAGAIGLDDLLELLLEQLFAVLQPEEGVILLTQPDGTLRTAASRRLPGTSGDLLVSQRLVAEVVAKNAAALVSDVDIDERFAGAHSVVSAGVRSILAAPFSDAEGCIGMVAIYSRTRIRRFREEDLDLLISLASAAALRIRNAALAEAAAARRVQDRELALAHEIQMGMLPARLPAGPDLAVAARLIPARAVGGDLYDVVVAGGAIWFIVADAAGKGMGAALFMAIARTLFRAVTHGATGVPAVVARMNAELARDNERQVFVTALVGRLVVGSGELTCCNAGHPPPLRLSRAGEVTEVAAGGGIALGIVEDAVYRETRLTLTRGDVLLLFTDGVTEALAASGDCFSDARLAQTLAMSAGQAIDAVVDGVVSAVETFAAGAPQEDDITILGIRWG
jgi:phosphoserine phosphatase RsbU/P